MKFWVLVLTVLTAASCSKPLRSNSSYTPKIAGFYQSVKNPETTIDLRQDGTAVLNELDLERLNTMTARERSVMGLRANKFTWR